MAAILGAVDTDGGPPLAIPIRHFVVGFGFLLAGALVGAATGLDRVPWTGTLAHVHLLLVGWVCVTIMGAMVQFVPVWSNATLHSRRLAAAQLPLVAGGLVLFAAALLTERLALLPVGGTLVLLGFWVFAYNTGRTLLSVRPWDVTERHFALALGFFLALTPLGLALAVGFTRPVFVDLPVTRPSVIAAHVTLAVFGAVLTTDDVRDVPAVFALASATNGCIRQNLAWAFVYNAVAIPLAAASLLNPLLAAVAMAASSLLVVGNSTRSLP